ncbi:MAG: hypothetical protein R3265_07535 [Hyphomonas sp.]|jgi:TRAP-type C4-dicarboxylate transport system permease small subunit|nr:hypothetical protein [Hyphomonas sp.]
MSIRRIIGLVLALMGGWLFWGGTRSVAMLVNRGSGLSDALMQPPTSLVRLVATGLILLGGLALLAGQGFGRWVALAGILVFTLLAGLMAASGADPILWADEAVTCGVFWVLFVGVSLTKRS